MMRYFSCRSQNSEYPRIFRVTGANQNARKLLSTDLVNTNKFYLVFACYQLKMMMTTLTRGPEYFIISKI